jgi:hypothetical protein
MGFETSHDRPLAALAAWAAIEGAPVRGHHSGPYVPPIAPDPPDREDVAADLGELCVGILRGVVLGEDLSTVRHRLSPDLITWSPHLFAVTRDQLLRSIGEADAAGERLPPTAGETLSEVSLDVVDLSATQGRVYAEWRLTVRFTSAEFIDDDLLIEPTGRLLETAGIQVVSFDGDAVVAVHCYYDDLALFEQLIMSR